MSLPIRKLSGRQLTSLKKSKSKSFEKEYTVQDLPSLRRKRTIAIKRLTKALEIGTVSLSETVQRDLFLSYYQELKQISSDFEHAHFTILQLLESDDDEDEEIQERFDQMYFEVISIYRKLTKGESSKSHDECNSSSSSSSNIKLPKIALPSFNGQDIKAWPKYIDIFNALIHNAKSLSDTEKFHYLISSLTGDALSVVKAYPMSHEYYHDAYQALVARYKCKRTLAFTCWKDLLNIDFKTNNAREFQKSLDLFEENLSILKSIDLPISKWDFILVYHILSKLDKDTRCDFEERYSLIELPSYFQLKDFLRSKCEALLRDNHFTELSKPNSSTKPTSNQTRRAHALFAATDKRDQHSQSKSCSDTESSNIHTASVLNKCPFCNDPHSITKCQDFLNKSLDDRMTIAQQKNWCYNCLKPSHQLKNCNSIFSCRTCKRKHHTLLHRDNSPTEPKLTGSTLVSRSQSNTTVLLATAIVQLQDASGKMQSFRALFDTGSQSNFITESAVNRLNLKSAPSTATVSGIGEADAPILGDVSCAVGTNNRVLFKLDMHVIPKVCGDQPIAQLNTSGWSHIKSLPLADPGFDIPGPIDILLAADVFVDSVLNPHIKGGVDQPTAFNSLFGWLLLGKTNNHTVQRPLVKLCPLPIED